MPSIGNTTRPAYVYDAETDTWIPVGTGPHTHTTAISDVTGLQAALDSEVSLSNYGAAGKNFLINGGFDIFQRSSFSTSTTGYGLDRWFVAASGSASATTMTQQTTGVPAGSRNCMRVTMGASGGYGNQYQFIETANVVPLQGKTATISIRLRRNSTFAGSLVVVVSKSSTVDAGMGATWTALTATGSNVASNASLPTGTGSSNWMTISYQVDIPNDGTANSLRVAIEQSQVESAGSYWEAAQAQLELGLFMTPFSRAGGTIQGEQDACERYLPSVVGSGNYYLGGMRSSTNAIFPVSFRVQPRVAPTGITISAVGDFFMFNSSLGGYGVTSLVYNTAGTSTGALDVGVSGGIGASVGDAVFLRAANANAKIFFTGCEL